MRLGWCIAFGALALLLAAGTPASAAPTSDPCMDKAMTQPEINRCAFKAAQVADERLNTAYRDLMRYLEPTEQAQLKAAEQAWIAFRDSDCGGFWGSGDYSLAPTNKYECLAELSDQRAKELESWPPNAPRSAIRPHAPGR